MEPDVTLGSKGAGPCRNCGQHSPGRWPGLRCHSCWNLLLDQRRQRVGGGPTALYRLYSAEGWLLYIGITTDTKRRFKEHHREPWWPLVARRDIEWLDYGGRRAAWTEIDAIRSELPLLNKSGFAENENGEAVWPNMPPGCPPQPWRLEYEAEYRVAWRQWWVVLRDCMLNAEEMAARDSLRCPGRCKAPSRRAVRP